MNDNSTLVLLGLSGRAMFCSIIGAAVRPLLRPWPHGGSMFTKLIGAATLFTAGSLMAGSSTSVGATPVEPFSAEAALTQAGACGTQGSKDEGKAPAQGNEGKAKDGSCGKGSCGSKDATKDKKEGSCGKDKKEASCGKDKKEASCGKDKKEASCGADKK